MATFDKPTATDTQPLEGEEKEPALSEMILETLGKQAELKEGAKEDVPGMSKLTKPQLKELALRLGEERSQLSLENETLRAELEELKGEQRAPAGEAPERALGQQIKALEERLIIEEAAHQRASMDSTHQQIQNERLKRRLKMLADPEHLDELERLAYTDELTGLLNRRGLRHKATPFIEHVAERTQTARELEQEGVQFRPETISVLFMDIDFFKRLNDEFGHATGDRALQTVARVLEQEVRGRDDFVCRWGGEEFVVVLNHDRPGLGFTVSERIRKAIGEIVIESVPSEPDEEPKRVSFTMSIGFERWQEGESLDDTIQRADASLYKAKNTGRNRVWSSTIEGIDEPVEQREPQENVVVE